MKVCEVCGEEIGTKDGENRCAKCETSKVTRAKRRNALNRDKVMRDLGMTKVRGMLGGTYYE